MFDSRSNAVIMSLAQEVVCMSISFDKPQKKAIYADEKPLLVLAGPGSGKTTVLVHRIRHLVEECSVSPDRVLVLTFTKASAEEMKERFLKLTEQNESKVTFGTFHSVFYAFLRNNGLNDISVISRKEELELTKEAITEILGICMLSDKTAGAVLDAVGRIKNGMPVEDELPVKVYPILREKMNKLHQIDFDDMLLLLFRQLSTDPDMVRQLRDRYRYILIDEFQDINRTQYEIIKIMAHPCDRVFAVGDDDQSIYGFRGSDPSYMKQFLKDFPEAGKIILVSNHRSVGKIVKASRRLIGHNRNRFEKKLVSSRESGPEPIYRTFETLEDQMAYVESKIRFYLENREKDGRKAYSFALLARTTQCLADGMKLISKEIREKVSAMTFHSSKGLEFDVVFILSAQEGVTPDKRSLNSEALEEERRCFYVAVTRCRTHLHILNTKLHYNKPAERSRFVSEMKLLWI